MYQRLCFFAGKMLGDLVAAEDIVQEAFVKLWKNWDEDKSLSQVKSYLYTIVRNDCLNYIKRQQIERKYMLLQQDDPADTGNQQYRMMEAEVAGEVNMALNKLPKECRKIFMMSYQEEYSNQQIADILHLSLQTVKNQKSRGYRILRTLLKSTVSIFL